MAAVEIADGGKVIWGPLTDVKVHPAATLFPLLEGPEFEALVEDIRVNGLHEPIVYTPDRQLLDGRNRYCACKQIGVTPQSKVVNLEPWAYVISTNMRRRHLTDSQRQMVAAKFAERMAGRPRKIRPIGRINEETADQPPTQEEAAELLNVNPRSARRARTVVRRGTTALNNAAYDNKVSVSKAAEIAKLSVEEQNEWVAQVNRGADSRRLPVPHAEPQEPPRRMGHSPDRHKWVRASSFHEVIALLEGLGLVLDGATNGLDPHISPLDAEYLESSLTKAHGSYSRALKLLRARMKEPAQ